MSRKASGKPSNGTVSLDDILFDLRKAWDGSVIFAGMPAANGDDDEGDGGNGGTETGEGVSGTGAEASQGDPDEGGTGNVKDPEKKRLHDEAAAHRTRAKAAEAKALELEKRLREFEDKDKSELEKAQRDAKELTERVEKAEAKAREMSVELAFFKSGASAMFKNPATGLRLLDLSSIKPDDDGVVDTKAIKAAAESLLKAEPYLAADGTSSDGDDNKPPSGKPNGNGSNRDANRATLEKKYPALRGRR